jgi:hypothetical protein
MTPQKQLTAAEQYEQIIASERSSDELFEVTSDSGMVWIVRQPDIEIYIRSKTLPLSLVAKMEAAQQSGQNSAEAFQSLNLEEKEKALDFCDILIRDMCVIPRVVDNPATGDEIAIGKILKKDYDFLVNWASGNRGGEQSDGLDDFRHVRGQSAVGKLNGKKQRAKSK